MPRFRILEHNFPFLHWDFLLETEAERLATWRLREPPRMTASNPEDSSENSIQQIAAEELPPHRRDYLDYVGPVSGNRGEVRDYEQGLYILLSRSDSHWEFRLEGESLRGFARLQKTSAGLARPETGSPESLEETGSPWLLTMVFDEA